MDEQALENRTAEGYAGASGGGADGVTSSARPRFSDPESWHDLAERGTPRNG